MKGAIPLYPLLYGSLFLLIFQQCASHLTFKCPIFEHDNDTIAPIEWMS